MGPRKPPKGHVVASPNGCLGCAGGTRSVFTAAGCCVRPSSHLTDTSQLRGFVSYSARLTLLFPACASVNLFARFFPRLSTLNLWSTHLPDLSPPSPSSPFPPMHTHSCWSSACPSLLLPPPTSASLRRRAGLLARNPEAVGGLAGLNWAAGIQHLYRTRRKKERPFGERVPPSTVAMLASQFDHYWPHAEMAYVACLLDLGLYSSTLAHLTRP